jgi:DNA-directed RNA polymerase specialized sigma24 family protein
MTAFSEKPATPRTEGAVPPTFSGLPPRAGDLSFKDGGEIKATIYQPGALGGTTGEEELSVESREQWCRFIKRERHYRRIIRNIVGRGYSDDVYQDLSESLFKHLQKNGPAKDIDSYAGRVAVNAAIKHQNKVRKMLELYVGDDAELLECATSPSFDENYGLRRILTVLREKKILTPHELRVFALRKGFEQDTRTTATLIGGRTSAASVRSSLSDANKKIKAAVAAGQLDELGEFLPQRSQQTED